MHLINGRFLKSTAVEIETVGGGRKAVEERSLAQ